MPVLGALRSAVAAPLDRRTQRLPGAHLGEELVHRRALPLAQDVPDAELQRVHAETARHFVEVRLHGEGALHLARAAHVAARQIVRVDVVLDEPGVGDVPVGRDAVDACQRAEGHQPGVRATVEVHLLQVGRDRAVALHAGPGVHDGGVLRVPCAEVLHLVHDHLHRTARPYGKQIGQRLVERRGLGAEVAADVDGVDDDRSLVDAERQGQRLPQSERGLVGRPDVRASVALHRNDAAARFEECRMRPRAVVVVLEDEVCLGEARVHVADAERRTEEHVGRLLGRAAETLVSAHIRMDEARVRLCRLLRIE